ncbi:MULTISPECIES: helix-turn-helix transcriptional regulator [Gluconobacter]|uniref:Transcriptional regulator n=1 Tax=Gluconobacter albidus TaxID=318683 RepID=A0AAW3R083_9PROT|nr:MULTISPECIES: helix-turn-helix transcriptional regulator [Gluconobacter]GBQ88142.1 putative transcriptional regulator [Gluconobacter albidus NBRC 3250]KXV42142.1 XRE family transcriptional regulator [Gluconobacter albidus]MCP1274619.1 helix-turn-helix transcriptional regulator [Gluconobacter albidus]OUI81145.1 XRE family transcriptional regulator [Gluconobacter sp. DsW_056]GLQ69407.1 transcriptional regulator [Gluconobacter albidus]
MTVIVPTSLGAYLKDRRTRLDPAAFGFSGTRRRTPGLRREEVAQRANISPTWYTWLEQGRGGAPSTDVLDRIARGLLLTEPEREHLFMLARGHAPEVRYRVPDGITPRLQRILDALQDSPAIVKTPLWDVVAWNRAAAAVLTDYSRLPPDQRNILRIVFCTPRVREMQMNWPSLARSVVAAFRADAIRAGASSEVDELVKELSARSPEFAALWQDNDVQSHGEGTKCLLHPDVGLIELEYSGFAVDGRPDLGLIIYNPATHADLHRIRTLIANSQADFLP